MIFTIWKDEVDQEGNIINGRIYFNNLEGKFIDGYRIEKGIFTKRFVIKSQTQKASFLPLLLFQSDVLTEEGDCWNTDTLGEFEGGVLDEVVITASGGGSGDGSGSGSSTGAGHSSSYNWYYTSGPGSTGYGGYINGATSYGSSGGGGGSSLSSGQVTSAAAAILMASPVDPDEEGKCPEGYKKNPTTGKCDPICTGGKIYDIATKKCNCPEGKIEDESGNCVKDPCYYLKKQINPKLNNVKPALQDLKTKLNLPSERGYAFIYNGTNYFNREIAVSAIEFNNVKPPVGKNIYGGAHSHTVDLHNMFSWSDIHVLFSLFNNANIDMKDDVIYYLVGWNSITNTEEVFAITVTDFLALQNQLNRDIINIIKTDATLTGASPLEEVINKLNNNLGNIYRNSTDLNLSFLNRFKNHGVKLYKADATITNFSELNIDASTNSIKQEPCK